MHIPVIHSFERDFLMLVSHTTTHYHQRVPIQVGSHIIDQVTNCITKDELQSLSQSWKVVCVSMIISKSALVSYPEFDLDQVKGKLVTSEKVKIPALQTVIVRGLTMVTEHQKHVHVLVEPSLKCTSVLILENTSELRPERSDVTVALRNLSGRNITLEACTEIGTVTAANIVLSTQVGNGSHLDVQERVPCMLPQVESIDLPRSLQQRSRDPRGILQKLDLSGIDEWESKLQQEAQDLIHEYACIFSQNDLDLGKTSIVKHSIKVNDPTPFKEYY